MQNQNWSNPEIALQNLVEESLQKCLDVYRHDPDRIEEDFKKEASITDGGYGRKQVQELVQNAADALQFENGQIEVYLTEQALYVANQGTPISQEGIRGLLYAHLSSKIGDEIGRFGLGFKSVGAISDNTKVYSQSVSFEFDRKRSQDVVTQELDYVDSRSEIPGLRLAWVIDPEIDFEEDPILQRLSNWAVTIIKVPLFLGTAPSLLEEMKSFDESFCLFTPRVKKLTMRSDVYNLERKFEAKRRGKEVELIDNAQESTRWLVISADHKPSIQALKSAGNAARRENIKVSWAVPLEGGAGVGNLSAYFPIKSEITLTGRLNAPWKLSDDRINLIESEFNREILQTVVPQLVVEARSHLVKDGDFGRYLDILPARGRESRSWADSVINEPIYAALRSTNSLPDSNGELRAPRSLKLPPIEVMNPSTAKPNSSEAHAISRHLVEEWLALVPLFGAWVHPACISSIERRSKTERLMALNVGSSHASIVEWIESLVDTSGEDTTRSGEAIKFVSEINEWIPTPDIFNFTTDAEVVLLETGIWVEPESSRCFIRSNDAEKGAGFIHPEVINVDGVPDALSLLGIQHYEETGQLNEVLRKATQTVRIDWNEFWATLRASDFDEIKKGFLSILSGNQRKIVRIMDGTGDFCLPANQLIPGKLLQDLKQDSKFLASSKFHRTDKEILELLDIREQPLRTLLSKKPSWFRTYRKEVEEQVGTQLGVPRAQWHQLDIGDSAMLLSHLDHFPELSETNRAILTKHILSNILATYLTVKGTNNKKVVDIIHPELWLVNKYGVVETTLGIRPINEAFLVDEDTDQIGDLVPVAEGFDLTDSVRRDIRTLTPLDQFSIDAFNQLVQLHVARNDEAAVGKAYAWWCLYYPDSIPENMAVQLEGKWLSLPPSQIAVSSVSSVEDSIEELGIPTLIVPELADTQNLALHWKLMIAADLPIEYRCEPSEEPGLLLLRFPSLQNLEREDLDELYFQPCIGLSRSTKIPGQPQVSKSATSGFDGTTLFTTSTTQRDQLIDVLSLLEQDTSEEYVELHLESLRKREENVFKERVRLAESDAERLYLIGGNEALISIIPKPAVDFIESTAGPLPRGTELAEICLEMFGTATLEKVCGRLNDNHPLAPLPRSWIGTADTRRWVHDLGFPDEYAGKKGPAKEKLTDYVDGPTFPGEFHDYQEKVSERLKAMLRGEGSSRGLITLPTGAGKTRVSVQSIIECIANDEISTSDGRTFKGPILWLANSAELCEQAIQTWDYLWRAFGKSRTRLALTRHFDKYNAVEEPDAIQIVFGTFQKTNKSTENLDYEWLSKTPLMVIDEAHSALARSYTNILKWSGRTSTQKDKLLLGLSATPYRGTSDSAETTRLLNRFDSNILDEGVFGDDEPLLRLQRDKVLSEVTMEIIRNEEFVPLSEDEISYFEERHFLPPAPMNQLAQDNDRTLRIVESIKSKPQDWSILVFAASIENAATIATALTLDGIPAASIDGQTPDKERIDILDRFKNGKLRVLTNFAVLTQGFDAPRTRAVYITRPTTSEVRYLQMIGRGLRGPKNGGTESVHIVNVLDNLQAFPESINYKQFEYLATNIEDA